MFLKWKETVSTTSAERRLLENQRYTLSTKCVANKNELAKSIKNGRYLIVYIPKYDDMIFYEIEALTGGKLNLFYEGKTLIYNKQQ